MKSEFSCHPRLMSFVYAWQGVATLIRTQPNARFHLCAMVVVLALAWYWRVSSFEWCLLVLAIGTVLSAEAANTALEILCDKVEPNQHPAIKQVKDLAAGAVLLAAMAAAVVGSIVFFPYFFT